MNNQGTGYAGADIIGKRYVLCVLDKDGMHPIYARGRADTTKGREKFFKTIPDDARLMIVASELAVLALHLLGDERVIIQEEVDSYAIWEKAGIERGERMANFAAKLLHTGGTQSTLGEKQKLQLLALQGEELKRIQGITDSSLAVMERIMEGSATEKDIAQAYENEYLSRVGSFLKEDQENEDQSPFASDDASFLAELYRLMQEIE
ncbi:MAG: hypothetical protein AB7D92_03065 [Sphaerochaeta sp.]